MIIKFVLNHKPQKDNKNQRIVLVIWLFSCSQTHASWKNNLQKIVLVDAKIYKFSIPLLESSLTLSKLKLVFNLQIILRQIHLPNKLG